jgi:hypothetical protein
VLSGKIFWCYEYCNADRGGHVVEGMCCVQSLNTGILGSHRTWAMDVCPQVFCVYISLCHYSPYYDVKTPRFTEPYQLTVSNSALERPEGTACNG